MALLAQFADRAQTIKVEQIDAAFRYRQARFDQTLTPVAECALEFILHKLSHENIARRGRFPNTVAGAAAVAQNQSTSKVPDGQTV